MHILNTCKIKMNRCVFSNIVTGHKPQLGCHYDFMGRKCTCNKKIKTQRVPHDDLLTAG